MGTCIAIPTLSALKPLKRLVSVLIADPEVEAVLILDNGHRSHQALQWLRQTPRAYPKVHVVDAHGWPIHRMWNYGWEWARAQGIEFYGAFNDDITAPAGLVTELAAALRRDHRLWLVSPHWNRPLNQGTDMSGKVRTVTGTQRHGGISGWCWLLRTDIPVPPVDETFEWWGGDDDLAFQITLAGGLLGVVEGLPLDHAQETTASRHAWTRDAIERDRVRFCDKYGPDSGW